MILINCGVVLLGVSLAFIDVISHNELSLLKTRFGLRGRNDQSE